MRRQDPRAIQRTYYEQTASHYDAAHIHSDGPHERAALIVANFMRATGSKRALDVGTGTGRALEILANQCPDLHVVGIDPSRALLNKAVEQRGVSSTTLVQSGGERLPFSNRSFDVVCSFGVLHHVRRPNSIVKEMARVSRHAVLISDSNRFGQGSMRARKLKLFLWKTHLWKPFDWARTRGKGYHFSEGDGVFYSYSVFDSLRTLKTSMNVVMTLANDERGMTPEKARGASQVLLCGFRDVDERIINQVLISD